MTVGRNDPCPCGSGKKYKKCCGNQAAAAHPAPAEAKPAAAEETPGGERPAKAGAPRASGARPAAAAAPKPKTEKRVTPPPVRRRAI